MKKVLCILIVLTITINITSGCRDNDGGNFIFKYDISGNPRTLDPQTATDENATMVISNIFEGLLKLDEDGNIVSGVAGEYSVSEDGKEYVFYLRDDIYWYCGDEEPLLCTAYDFVFAFNRLFNPATKSQNTEPFYCIANSARIHKGQNGDTDDTNRELGVRAADDFTLIFTLDYPNPLFINLLTTTPSMPCNQALYDRTSGRYGLTADATPSNGAFYLYQWNYDKYSTNNNNLILRRNNKNNENENNRIYPYGLNFFIEEPDIVENFINGSNHSLILSGEKAVELINKGYPHNDYENSTWGIVFNTRGVFKNKELRYALAASFQREKLEVYETGYRTTDMLIPNIVKLGGKSFRNLFEQQLYVDYDAEKAKKSYEKGVEEVGYNKLNGLDLIVVQNDTIIEYLGYLTQQWQGNLGFFCNIKPVSQSTLSDNEFDFAVVKISGDYNSPSAFLRQFNSSSLSGYSSMEYDMLLTNAERAADISKSAEYYIQAEKKLLNEYVFIPLCFQTEYFIYNKKCTDIIYNPFTRTIDYREAKYFS